METLLIIVAFWLILIGVYGAIFLPRNRVKPARRPDRQTPLAPPAFRQRLLSEMQSPRNPEVDFLRAQVEQLRSEVLALSGDSAPRGGRVTTRRGSGATAHLPRPLRRQVRELRTTRRVVRA